MTDPYRSLASLALLFATVAGLAQAQPGWLRELERDLWELPELRRKLESAQQRRADLEERGEVIRRRIRAKEAAIDALIAGRVTLFQAAATFRAVNKKRLAKDPEVGRDVYRGRSDEERCCRQVLSVTRGRRLLLPPGIIDNLVRRLEADLEDHLRRHGDVRLPAVE